MSPYWLTPNARRILVAQGIPLGAAFTARPRPTVGGVRYPRNQDFPPFQNPHWYAPCGADVPMPLLHGVIMPF